MINTKRLKNHLHDERGLALIVVLMLLTVVSVLGIALMGMALTNHKMNSVERDYQSTYYIAESGVTYMLNEITTNITEVYDNSFDAVDFFNDMEQSFNMQSPVTYNNLFQKNFGETPEAKVWIEAGEAVNDTTKQYKILSEGKIGNRTRKVERTFNINWIPRDDLDIDIPIDKAVFTKTTIDLSGGADIYGDVGVNSSEPNSVTLSGSTKISGDIYVGPEANKNNVVNKPNHIEINEIIHLPKEKILKLPPFPTFPQLPLHPNAKVIDHGGKDYYFISAGEVLIEKSFTDNKTIRLDRDMAFTDIVIKSNYKLNIDVGNSDRSIVVNNLNLSNGNINILGSGKLTIYVVDGITMSSGSTINNAENVENLEIYYKGSVNPSYVKNLELSGAQKIYGSLYAEDAQIKFSGGSGFQGHIVTGGSRFTIDGGAYANSQVIFAPNADFQLSGGGEVKGVIITNSFSASGGAKTTFVPLENKDIPFFSGNKAEQHTVSVEELIYAKPTKETK